MAIATYALPYGYCHLCATLLLLPPLRYPCPNPCCPQLVTARYGAPVVVFNLLRT